MRTKVRIKSGAWIILAFLAFGGYRFFNMSSILPWLAAVVLHESGHLAAASFLCVSVREISFGVLGIRIHLDTGLISYGKEAIIAAAGPLINLFSFFIFRNYDNFALFSVALAIINLLPIKTFDGGRIIFSIVASCFGIECAQRTTYIMSVIFVIFMWSIAVYFLIRYGANFPFFLLSCALFVSVCL